MIRLHFTMMRSSMAWARAAIRRVFLPVLAVAAAMLAGCQSGEQNYLTNGIGSELTAPGLVRTESLQNQYFSYLCRQATSQSYEPNASCQVDSWNLIVQQGMNDIDRRCDAYLQWLDNRKRSKGPWISQIGDTAAATAAVLGQVDAGTDAITIVGQAFQLLTKSVENYHSRLLLEIESSTVHSIVLKGRYDYRSYIQKQRIQFVTKPDAEHALRSYTRLCLPFAIEAKINDFSTLGARGETPGEAGSFGDLPVVGTVTSNTTVFKPDRGQGTQNPVTVKKIAEAIQKALCVPADGKVGPRTVEAIRAYQYVQKQAETGELSKNVEEDIINTFGPGQPKQFAECDPQFSNFLERDSFQNDPANAVALGQLRDDLRTLAQKHGAAVEISDADTLATLRPKIAAIKQRIGGDVFRSGNKAFLNTQFTPDLERML
ncbi:peptidoglycan-binding protein [Mesorhizobium sp. M0320]|uniref:peptidoglycan-binding domain-containing protein n=1 Tax=Mesorhizobium sp. M0320 TaxID=2956936 RepID=UPI0033379861